MEGSRQLRLLLWRDYLIRKRQFITLAGILWATGIMVGIYTVRINIDNQDFPTCQFPARALPSAGVMPFLQSFICSVNNECSPMDQFEEIPSYRSSKLTQISSKLAPLLNETVLELAGSMPDAVKLLATVADVADEPTFKQFSKDGLKLSDLFRNPSRVKQLMTTQLHLDVDVANSLMTAEISFQGILNGNLDRCDPSSVSQTLVVANSQHLSAISRSLCALTEQQLQNMMMELIFEVNFTKYISMFGNMYFKLSGDARLSSLGQFLSALIRMSRLQNFLPPEAAGLFLGNQPSESYMPLSLVTKFIDLFEPTFGETTEYQNVKEFADAAVIGIRYISKVFGNASTTPGESDLPASMQDLSMDKLNKVLDNAAASVGEEAVDPFNVLTKLSNIIIKFMPKYKHDIFFYSTLIAKLLESAQRVIEINMHIEEITYGVTLRHTRAVELLKQLKPEIVGHAFEALVSAERTQILISNMHSPGALFCDVAKLQAFLLVSKAEAESAKTQLCSDAWKDYVTDLAAAFGVSSVRNHINEMASLLIQETLGKDTSAQLYSIERDFQVLRNFTHALTSMDSQQQPGSDWKTLLGTGGNQLMDVVKEKAHLGKLILISVHGALAKEIVKQNTILQFKITPILLNADTFISALTRQLDATPSQVSEGLRLVYADAVRSVASTANHEEKTYRCLSTYSEDIVCNGGDIDNYLQIPGDVDSERLARALCDASRAIEDGLKNDSLISKAIAEINNTTHSIMEEVNWTKLISNIQKLYIKLDEDYPYIFEYSTYAMDSVTQQNVKDIFAKAKEYWFGIRNLQRGLHLSVNLGFRLLDLLDHGIFNMMSETWLRMKFFISNAVGPMVVIDDSVKLVTALLMNTSHTSNLPPITARALSVIVPTLPQLIMDTANIIINDDTDIEPIISIMNASPPWPCSTASVSELLALMASSKRAVLAMETLLCMDRSLQDEWIDYLNRTNAKIDKTLAYNTTHYGPHLFLKLSSAFNSVINDTGLMTATLKHIAADDTNGTVGLLTAWKYALDAFNGTEGNIMLRKFISKFDTVLNSINTTSIDTSVPLNTLWERYVACINGSYTDGCRDQGRAVWKNALRVLSVIFENVAIDLTTYFTEANDPNSNLLQMFGFTKNTTLYMLYDKLPEFFGVLITSYWDYGFMSQVRRASQTQFWDCEALVSALVPAPDSPIHDADIARVQPYVCPSFVYWISLPRDDNVLFNLVAKPQYYFYSYPVQESTSSFESTFTKAVALKEFVTNIAKENMTLPAEEVRQDNMKDQLVKFIDKVLNYRLKETDDRYTQFSEMNKKQFMSTVYLTRIVAIVNKLSAAITNLTIGEDFIANEKIEQEDVVKINADLSIIKNIFKRKAVDAIALHYDLLTDVLWTHNDNYTLINAMDTMCHNLKEKSSKAILVDEVRTQIQICAKNYRVLYGAVKNFIVDDYEDARQSLLNLVKVLQSGDNSAVTDVFEFLKSRTRLVKFIKHSIKHSYDLGLPIYLKYLQSNLQSYRVLLSFLSGGDWWRELRQLYNGTESSKFFGYAERGFDVADNFLNNLDGVHLVRLIRDINTVESASFCRTNLTLSDYIPDATGALTDLKNQLCSVDSVQLYGEVPPLLFAAQGYESSLKLSKDIDYTSLNMDISTLESSIDLISSGPKEPQKPDWVTEEKLDLFRTDVVNLLSKETLTKISFGILSNGVDAGTLFLNNSECTLCSQLTSWFKQLNLQLFKKQEYDSLLCHLNAMSLDDVYYTLHNDFHWDMFVRECISSRNYTKFELNKAMSEFLSLVKAHLLEDLRTPTTKLTECLAANVTHNAVGNATVVLQVLSLTAKLLRAEAPHLSKVEGVRDLPYLKQLHKEVAHRLDVHRPLQEYLKGGLDLRSLLADDEVVMDLMEADINLRTAINGSGDIDELLRLRTNRWQHICNDYDCGDIYTMIVDDLNTTKIESDLSPLQSSSYWQFSFMSSILHHLEGILSHAARLSGVASSLDLAGVAGGSMTAMLDVGLTLLMDDNVDTILYSLEGLILELRPLLKDTSLDEDLQALASGLRTLHQFKTYLIVEADLSIPVAAYFPEAARVETGLAALGINNTNFWSLAAPRIHAGHIHLKPVLSSKNRDFHIASFVCEMDELTSVLEPADLGVVSMDEVAAATLEQFCPLSEEVAKDVVKVLARNAEYSPVIDKVKDHLLSKLYSASDLTPAQGSLLLQRFPRMAAMLPTLQRSLRGIMQDLAQEPLFQQLREFSSVGNLMSSPAFLENAGNMMCGKPFNTDMGRIIGKIITSKDQAEGVSQAQLDVLPTEFCRSMYKEIISMDGGKIVWSFVKPLLMGKILYTPQTQTVHDIIEKANSTFASMIRMTSLVHSFSSAFPSLDSISAHREGISAVQGLVSRQGMQALRSRLLGDVQLDVDVEELFHDAGDLNGIGQLVSKASALLQCINLDRFSASPDETALMHEAARLSQLNEFTAGIVFLNEDKLDELTNIEYKIRMDIENAPTTARTHSFFWTPGPESSFIENMRYFRGFIQIQDLVDKAVIQLAAERSRTKEPFRRKRDVEHVDWAVYTQQEPYPCYRKDSFQTSLYESQALIVAFFFCFVFTVTSVVRFIVADKESGNTMLMSVMGVNLHYHTLSWFLCSLAELCVTEACVMAVLRGGGILPRTDPGLLFFMLLLFGASILSFCYLLSRLFSSASSAAVCGGLAYMTTFMPFVLIISLEAIISLKLKLVVCLSMSSALCYAFLFVVRLEAMGHGVAWADVWDSPGDGDMNIASAMAMVLFDALLYAAIGLAIDRYWGIRSLRSNIITSTSDDKAGVSIINVCKTYAPGGRRAKQALDNVSIELHRGQITTLLGHNGAGKTTLTNILTGMLRPTSGHVVLRGGGGRVGACPQHDVLVPCLTPREHITLYAQLSNALDEDKLREEVDGMLGVLSLGPVAEQQVSQLSGGTRRRVCVALAFVGRPTLVSLDEPTAGVDPAARKQIWDMIVKLKEDRTILLTTHHLDEAEILSDQIVIMHKGQVHTTGSPVEIKRSLGTGYKLTLTLPDKRDDYSSEERVKSVVATVRDVVKNASVVDISGDLELVLPFYDADGTSNNFLQLCCTLEQSQARLGFLSYSLDCSTLEQVFCDICHAAYTRHATEDAAGEMSSKIDFPSGSGSSSSRSFGSGAPVACGGARRGARTRQMLALLRARYQHLARNKWLLFMLVALPTLFVTAALGFSMIRPPPDNEVSLPLTDTLYPLTTQYMVSNPSIYSENVDPSFAERVMSLLQYDKTTKDWDVRDSPDCKCLENRQECEYSNLTRARPAPVMMVLPDVDTLNNWIVDTQEIYIEKRFGGYTSTLANNLTSLVAWYNNKGHHAMPTFLSVLNNAILRAVLRTNATITTYSHPMKISKEQLNKDTVYQHVADAGVCALVLIAFSAAAAGGAVPLVRARQSEEKRLQLLAAVSPAVYWGCALLWDMLIIGVNMVLTAAVMSAFGFPVFVERSNLVAICILIMLFGYACSALVHVTEKLFSSASLANMMLFCGNAFLGLAGITILLILDIISESEATDNARWVLHKIFLLSPQFALGDGMLEIAKNTIQAQVLYRFGMDTYRSPLSSDLIALHVCALASVGTALLLLNLAIEYGHLDSILHRWNYQRIEEPIRSDEPEDVSNERRRVAASLADRERPLSVHTIGNINRGFVHTEGKKNSLQRSVMTARDVAQCVGVSKAYPTRGQRRLAVMDLTLGIAPGQCLALLGENGAGKSTTFSMLCGQTRPTRGQVYLDGQPRDARGLCRGLISYCPQSDAIDPLLTVQETLQLYCRLRGIADEDDVIPRTMEMFDLCKYSGVRSGALSGGNKRKLCTAIAFMARTPLVLLDEPTSGMDPVSRACVWRGVASARAARRGVLLSTHALDDARRAAGRVALMAHGRLIALASLEDCLNRFGGGYVVQCTCSSTATAWRGVQRRAPHAALRVMHQRALHFHIPTRVTVDNKEVLTSLSDIFRVMSELQATCDIEDYTVNQSSLEQMFHSFSDKLELEDSIDIQPLPQVAHRYRHDSEPLDSVTSL